MRVREGLLLLVGAAVGAGLVLMAGERQGGEIRRSPGPVEALAPAPILAVVPGSAGPAPRVESARSEEGPGLPGVKGLGVGTLDLALQFQQLLLDRKGVPRESGKPGFAGNPHAAMGQEELAEAREKAALVVEPLLAKWREAAPGEERAAAMKDLAVPMFRLLEAGGSMEHLVTLEEAAERGETAVERKWALIATHTLWQAPVVDFLLARAQSAHAEVRFYALEGLAWVRGDEMQRALEGVVRGLDDADPGVRRIAAVSLGLIVADPAMAEAILERLGRETDPGAAAAMAGAVLRLDPEGGKDRVEKALITVPTEVRLAVEKAIAAKGK